MEHDTGVEKHRTPGRYVHFIDWLNHRLMGPIGPPDLGPYDEVVKRVGDALCPVCAHPMAEHTIDHSTPNTVLNCPAPPIPERFDDAPINEFGMPKRDAAPKNSGQNDPGPRS